jgi:phosphatidate cytidylyltransferase
VGARALAAIPAIALALFLVIEGGLVFTVGLIVLGGVCMHEFYAMYERARPVRVAGLLALAGLLFAAHYGSQFQILLVAVIALPLTFGLGLLAPRPSVGSLAVTILGIYWIGFALAHAVLLRELPHGEGIVIDVLVGTFLGDTAAYFGGRMFGKRPLAPSISPNKTVEGLVIGMLGAILGVWIAGRYQEWLPGSHALVIGLGWRKGAVETCSSRSSSGGAHQGLGALFGATVERSRPPDAVLFTAVVSYTSGRRP